MKTFSQAGRFALAAVVAAGLSSATQATAQTVPIRYLQIPSTIGSSPLDRNPVSTLASGSEFILPGYGRVRVERTDFPTSDTNCANTGGVSGHPAVLTHPGYTRGELSPAAHFAASTPLGGGSTVFSWGNDTRFIGIFTSQDCAGADTPSVTYRFLDGPPDLSRLLLEVNALAPASTATIPFEFFLVGEFDPNSTDAQTQVLSPTVIGNTDTKQNTAWTLMQFVGDSDTSLTTSSNPFLTIDFKRAEDDGIGTTLAYTQPADGVLKVCKVAGPGVHVGDLFTFKDSFGFTYVVPAGAGPGGTCVLGPSYGGKTVSLWEVIPTAGAVTSIAVEPAAAIAAGTTPDLATGKVTLKPGPGVTEATFTDTVVTTGYLEICKTGDVSGAYRFRVSGLAGPITVPAGACSPSLKVTAGQVQIREVLLAANTRWRGAGCSTIPATRQGACNTAGRTSTVTVVPGGVASQTIAIITNEMEP